MPLSEDLGATTSQPPQIDPAYKCFVSPVVDQFKALLITRKSEVGKKKDPSSMETKKARAQSDLRH